MSIATIVQFAALAVIVGIGVCIVYVIFEMRAVYAEQQDKFLRAVSAVEQLHKLQPEFLAVLQRVESDGHALQKIAIQIEVATAALKNAIGGAVMSAAERQTNAIDDLRDHLDTQETRLADIVARISEEMRNLPQPAPMPQPQQIVEPPATVPDPQSEPMAGAAAKADNGDYVRLRRDAVSNDSQLRFSLLKEWVTINTLAIQRRAARGWTTPADLIATIPTYLQPEAEVSDDGVLLVSTSGHAEKLPISIRDLEPSQRSGTEPVYSRI